ncbi:uncharacterized protein PG986_008719 [Apiospora aurea]|uniref:TPR-like protein n=1 Tax=Apiospora aurea TaxID=335848 RepID=A0ABR1Q5U9_9PEZI
MDEKEELAEYQYFKVDTVPEEPQPVETTISDAPKPEIPQPVKATMSAIPRLRDDLHQHSNISPRVSRIIGPKQDGPREPQELKKAWLKRSEYAQLYLQNCSFHNATALYESCITMARELPSQDSDIVFRSRIQLAVIKIMRGQYKVAISDLVSLNEEIQEKLNKRFNITDLSISADISYHHAVALVRVGDFKDATDELKDLSRILEDVDNKYLWVNHKEAKRKIEEEEKYGTVASTTVSKEVPGFGSSKEPGAEEQLFGLKAAVSLSEAQILLLRGKAEEGLALVKRLSGDLEKKFGVSHLLTLEARFVWCRLLTEKGQLDHAKSMCVEIIDLMTRHLDRDHPLTLKATSALVGIQRLDSCPSEAFTTSENLTYRSREVLGTGNRQTLRYEFQMAALSLWDGNHANALKQLENATSKSREKWGDESPWTLSCAIEHSIALSLSGRSGDCKKALEKVLCIQSRLFELGIDDRKIDNFVDNLIEFLTTASQQPKNEIEIHPIILHALGAWAKNELTRSGASRERVIQAQLAILDIRKASPSFQPGHFATLQAGLDLANTLRLDPDPKQSQAAESYYSEVIRSGTALQGHPIVLLSEQGQHLCKMMHNPDSISEADTERFLNIPKLMSLRLGSRHPDTLQALLTAFAAVCCINEDRAADMSAELRQRLHDPKVRPLRPIECIQIEEKLGLIHYRLGRKTEAADIFAALARSLRDGEREELAGFPEGTEILSRLDREISKILKEELERQWERAEAAKQDGRHSDMVDSLRVFSSLFKAVHGEHDEAAESASLNLAVALWKAGQQETGQSGTGSTKRSSRRQQEEAVDILQGIISRMSPEDGVRARLEEGLKGWEAELAASSPHKPSLPTDSSFADSVKSRVSVDDCRGIQKDQDDELDSL